jgi:hypothetical protein
MPTRPVQPPDGMRLIGVLMGFAESDPEARSCLAAFRGALAKLGWTEGDDLRIELRWTGTDVNAFFSSSPRFSRTRSQRSVNL